MKAAEPVITDNFVQCHSRGGAALCATARTDLKRSAKT
jgi:hypothetical protein